MPQPRISKPAASVYVAAVRLADGSTEMAKVVRVDDLRLPIHICLGRFEAATEEELHDLTEDGLHELTRRCVPTRLA